MKWKDISIIFTTWFLIITIQYSYGQNALHQEASNHHHPLRVEKLKGNWLFSKGSFPDSIIELNYSPAIIDSTKNYNGYTIAANGALTFFTYAPPRQRMCGNGIPSMKEGQVTEGPGSTLHLTMKGSYLGEGSFAYDLIYEGHLQSVKVKHRSTPLRLSLRRVKVIQLERAYN